MVGQFMQRLRRGGTGTHSVDHITLRARDFQDPLPEALQQALARYDSPGMTLESFGEGRRFPSSTDFLAEWTSYERDTLSLYQSRGSDTVRAANAKRMRDFLARGESVDSEAFRAGIIPDELGHALITRRCRHGVFKKSRGKGKRKTKSSNYLECPARITCSAERDADGNWSLVTKNEFSFHSHRCTQPMLDSYGHSALLTHPEIARDVKGMLQAGAASRNICDTVAANYGVAITSKQLANLKRDRLGGQAAVSNLKLLLQRFAAFAGSRCLIIDDQHGDMCAVVMQSAAQRKMFELYGDNLILDWTYNTNNMGFYLGSLMVTSATGRGVSVCDFLCLEQTEAMMTAVFDYFVEVNPEALTKVLSFVIDKDYKEWRVIERVFPETTVLLCQFHVAKWFAYVVTMRKYQLTVDMREKVLDLLSEMIYARTLTTFDVLVSDLDGLLREVCPDFLKYLDERWYSCRRMWADCERALVFAALNTTSNRIESSWNQIKSFLGKKLRIDLCVEAVFAYQTAVMRREHRTISKYEHQLILRAEVDPFMRSAMAEVCEFACEKVSSEWTSYRAHDEDTGREYLTWRAGSSYMVMRGGPEASTYAVDATLAGCTCAFSASSALPCRHTIYVARRLLRHLEFPREVISERWKLSGAFSVLPAVMACTLQIQTLRTALLLTDTAFSNLVETDVVENDVVESAPVNRVAYKRVNRGERSDTVVFDNLQKRSIVESSLEELVAFVVSQSTASFVTLVVDLKEWVSERMQLLEGRVGENGISSPAVDVAEDIDEAVATAMSQEDGAFADADWRQRMLRFQQQYVLRGRVGDEDSSMLDMLQDYKDFVGALDVGPTDSSWRLPSPPGSPPSSVSTTGMAALLNPVVEHDVLARDTGEIDDRSDSLSLATTDVSKMMSRVARHQLTSDAPATKAAHLPKHKPVPRSGRAALDAQWFRDVLGSDCDEAELASSVGAVPTAREDDVHQGLTKRTLTRVVKGCTKRQKTSGASGDRYNYADQASDCPADLSCIVITFMHTPDIDLVAILWKMVPRRFDAAWVAALSAEASMTTFWVRDLVVNFRVKRSFMKKLKVALTGQLKTRRSLGTEDRVDLTSLGDTGLVDLTPGARDPANERVTQAVVHLAPELRGFSKDNIVKFEEFFWILDASASYKADKLWLERGVLGEERIVPYMHGTIIQRGLFPPSPAFPTYGVGSSARQSILAVLGRSSFSTTFKIPTTLPTLATPRPDLDMSISVADIVGFAARSAELNDFVLMYALRQLATDFPDVHVADCLDTPPCRPYLHLQRTRWVLFPRNFSRVHWGIVLVEIRDGEVSTVLLYDPLQGLYENTLKQDWMRVCRPYLHAWAGRDGLYPAPDPELQALRMPKQHDGSSCGVYCVAVALDVVSGATFFTAPDCQLASVIPELRVRILWRIFCCSARIDHEDEEAEARRVVAALKDMKPEVKVTGVARANMKKIARHGSNWRG